MSVFNVVTPLSRYENLTSLQAMMATQGVQWHLLLDEGRSIPDIPEWMHTYNIRRPAPGFFPGHWLYNIFLDGELEDDQYYNLITDDDSFETGMFDKLRAFDDPVLITSMDRGKWGTLWATPEHVKIGSMGLEQLHIKGWLIKKYRLNGFYESDGFLLEQIWREHADKFRFVPEAHCYFNFLPPGRPHLW